MLLSLSSSKYGVNGNCYLLLAAIKEFNVAAIDGWLVTERERFGSVRYGTVRLSSYDFGCLSFDLCRSQ